MANMTNYLDKQIDEAAAQLLSTCDSATPRPAEDLQMAGINADAERRAYRLKTKRRWEIVSLFLMSCDPS
jgi:hypothetical protein